MLSFLQEAEGEVPVSSGSDKSTACGAPTSPQSPTQNPTAPPPGLRQQQCEQYGTVRTPRTGTSAISSTHNGSAQVVQVVVCHALCAAREIEWKAFPLSWQSPKHVCEKPLCVFVCEEERNRRRNNEPVSVLMPLSLIMFTSYKSCYYKFKFYSQALS